MKISQNNNSPCLKGIIKKSMIAAVTHSSVEEDIDIRNFSQYDQGTQMNKTLIVMTSNTKINCFSSVFSPYFMIV